MWNGQQHLGMAHEASKQSTISTFRYIGCRHGEEWPESYLVMRSSMLLGSKIKVGRVTRLRSAPGRS